MESVGEGAALSFTSRSTSSLETWWGSKNDPSVILAMTYAKSFTLNDACGGKFNLSSNS